jgi:putative heme degradation protein
MQSNNFTRLSAGENMSLTVTEKYDLRLFYERDLWILLEKMRETTEKDYEDEFHNL